MSNKLYPHQIKAVKFALKAFNGSKKGILIADEMGAGKTIEAIAIAKEIKAERILIITQVSIVSQWIKEVKKWMGIEIKPFGVEENIVITSYSKLISPKYFPIYAQYNWDLIIADEAHKLKNWKTKTTKAFRKLKTRKIILLTGTPIYNQLIDLFFLVNLISPGRLGKLKEFLINNTDFIAFTYDQYKGAITSLPKRFFEKRLIETKSPKIVGYKILSLTKEGKELNEKLKDIVIRRTLAEIAKDLPPIITEIREVEMTPFQVNKYREAVNELSVEIKNKKLILHNFLVKLLRLKQISISLKLLGIEDKSKKLEEAKEIAEEARKAVIFTQFKGVVNLFKCDLPTWRFTGDLPLEKRKKIVEEFDKACEGILIATIDSFGEGIHLNSANTIIFIDEHPYIPSKNEQAMMRLRDFKSNKPLVVIKIKTRIPNYLVEDVEEIIENALKLKISISKEALC